MWQFFVKKHYFYKVFCFTVMRKSTILLLLFFPLLLAAQQAGSIKRSIDRLLNDALLQTSDASVMVYDLDADSLLYAHREHKIVRPASVQKVLTSVVALEKLGVEYTMDTELFKERRNGSCNLYVKGRMDPLFNDKDMAAMAKMAGKGMIVDTLFADCSFTDSLYWGSGWIWDDNPYGFQPYLSPLMVCGGAVEVVVKPASKGKAPHFKVTPESSFYSVVNEARSKTPVLGKLTILRDWLEDSNLIRIRGNCENEYKEKINMYKSADFFLAMLVEKLKAEGVEVKAVAFGKVPNGAQLVHTVRRPLADVVDEALMESDNLCAEAMLFHIAATVNSAPLSMEQGCKVIAGFADKQLGASKGYNIADGSGLSTYNYLSADILMRALKYAHRDKEIFNVIFKHLPLSGVSGTMQHRTKETAAYKRVRAKTGTVRGVCTLAGYAVASNGHKLAFVILNSGSQKSSPVRKWQDKILEILCK